MKKQIKTIALVTTGLVVGVVVARNNNKDKNGNCSILSVNNKRLNVHRLHNQIDILQEIVRFQNENLRKEILRNN